MDGSSTIECEARSTTGQLGLWSCLCKNGAEVSEKEKNSKTQDFSHSYILGFPYSLSKNIILSLKFD